MSTATPPELDGLVYRERIGSGGYADVYLYEQQAPRMRVAVKVLKGEGITDAIRRQFRDEADTMAQLADHPYIVQVFRSGTSTDGLGGTLPETGIGSGVIYDPHGWVLTNPLVVATTNGYQLRFKGLQVAVRVGQTEISVHPLTVNQTAPGLKKAQSFAAIVAKRVRAAA